MVLDTTILGKLQLGSNSCGYLNIVTKFEVRMKNVYLKS